MNSCELLIVGGGPAGIAAAHQASRFGVQVVLLDEQPALGGQYLAPHRDSRHRHFATERRGHRLIESLDRGHIEIRTQTLAWSATSDHQFGISGPCGVETIKATAAIVATGARETVFPFPGWTLPGVMTVGGAQLWVKRHAISPGRKILIAGSGPLLLPAALHLTEAGAEVVAIVERFPLTRWLRFAKSLRGDLDRVAEGTNYLWRKAARRIPYRFGWTVRRAEGDSRVESVQLARVDRDGNPMLGPSEEIAVDTVCVSDGLIPNTEITRLVGCRHHYDRKRGGWTPVTNELQETSVSGLYAIGETAVIAGAHAGMLDGMLAATAIARQLGKASQQDLLELQTSTLRSRRTQRRFGTALNELFAMPKGATTTIPDGTPICRCEEVSIDEIRRSIRQGAHTLDALKKWTRVGQGPCQGRTCEPILQQLLAEELAVAAETISPFPVRPPLKPIRLGSFVEGSLT